jgi:hypothetical protein
VAALGRALLPYAGQKTRLLWEKALGREPDGRGAAPRPHASQDALADTCLGPAVATAPGLACTQLPPAGSRPAAVALTAGAAAFAAGGSTAGAAPGRAAAGPGGAALGPTAEVVRVRTRPWPIPLVGDPGMSTTAAVSGSVQGPPPRSYGLGLWVWAAAVLVVGVGVGLALVVRQPGPAAGRIDEQPAAAVKNPAGAFRPDALPPAMSAPLQFVPSSLADSAGRAAALHGRPRAADGAQRPDAASSPGRRHGRDARPDDAVTVGGRSTRSPRLEIEPEGRAAPSPRVAPAPATRATAGDSAAPAGATGAVGPAGPSLEVEP